MKIKKNRIKNVKDYFCLIVMPRVFLSLRDIRPMIKMIKKNNWNDIVGVEIGVCKGFNALDMLRNLDIKHLYLIDPYNIYVKDDVNMCSMMYQKIARKVLRRFDDKITFVEKYSCDAVYDIPDDVDFVYIDGNHTYDFVLNDCILYYSKVKQNGFIGGHDFCCGYPDVPRAVFDFVGRYGLVLNGDNNDWWCKKI